MFIDFAEWLAITAGLVAVIASLLPLVTKLLTQRRVEPERGDTGATVIVKVGDDKVTLDLDDPDDAAAFLAALESSRSGDEALGRILKYRAKSGPDEPESR
jgi:hypothetical protein